MTTGQQRQTKIGELLDTIVSRNELSFPDGRPLYAYRTTSDELETIKHYLASRISLVGKIRSLEERAAFCLFAAETFRRHYAGGPYRYRVIFDQLECNERSAEHLSKTIREVADDGLKWWKIPVIRSALDSQFRLKTLACHGGFPHYVLSKNGAILRRFLCDVLRSYEQYDQPISEVVAEASGLLPQTINQPVVHDLAADLVTSLAELRRKSDDAKAAGLSRRDFLDLNHPGWSAKLPLEVSDEDAQQMLLTLLDTQRVYISERKPFAIRTSLRLVGNQAQLVRQLHFPNRPSIQSFRQSLELADDVEIPSRMSGYLVSGQRSEHCMSIVRLSDGKSLQLRPLGDATVIIESQTIDARLCLESGHEQIASVVVPGGEALPGSPWVFQAEDSGDWIGDGSVRTRHTSVIVAVPADAEIDDSEAEVLETLEQTLLHRRLIRVSGRLSLSVGDSLFRIQTDTADVSQFSFELCGKNRQLGLGGHTVWIGTPAVRFTDTSDPDASAKSVPEHQIQWKSRHGGSWSSLNDNCIGEVWMRVVEDGETRLLTDATVFPADLKFQLRAGDKQGSLQLKKLGAKSVYVGKDENIEADVQCGDEDCIINVSVTGVRPQTIPTKIEWECGGRAEVSFVCPTEACAIVDANGDEVRQRRGIPLDRLDGLRLQVVDPRERVGFLYSKDGMLLVEQLRPTRVKGISQLPLSLIQDAAKENLAKSTSNDLSVTFGLYYRNDISASFEFGVKRYSRNLREERNHELSEQNVIQVFLDASTGDAPLDELVAGPIADPFNDSYSDAVDRVSEGRWNVDAEMLPPGGYLLHVRNVGRETIRPLLKTLRHDEIPQLDLLDCPTEDQFDAVCNITDYKARQSAWGRLITEMVDHPNHPAWRRIESLIDDSEHMPITSFDSVVALTRHPAAIARIGMQNPGKARLWDRFEELPFLWSLVPISTWIQTANQTIAAVKVMFNEMDVDESIIENMIQSRVDDFAKNAPLRCPSLSCVVALMKYVSGFPIQPQAAGDCMACATLDDRERERRNLFASLGRIDKYIQWPELNLDISGFSKEKLSEIPGLWIADSMPHQSSVLNAPAIAAMHCVYDLPVSKKQLSILRTLRSFHLPWYENANRIAIHLLAEHRSRSDSEWTESLK